MSENIYLKLTEEFNQNKLRAVICSGQAVVLHKLAIMSKDGDWILREDQETLEHILKILESRNAYYRFGAPLDLKWLSNGWSSHFEFRTETMRVRADFFTRPPRLTTEDLGAMWAEQENKSPAFTNLRHLAIIKQTNREKDHAIIGEIARRMVKVKDQLEFSKSARDLILLATQYPQETKKIATIRPLLTFAIAGNQEQLEEEIDRERRRQIKKNEERLATYATAAKNWKQKWPHVEEMIQGKSLLDAHKILSMEASGVLPQNVDYFSKTSNSEGI